MEREVCCECEGLGPDLVCGGGSCGRAFHAEWWAVFGPARRFGGGLTRVAHRSIHVDAEDVMERAEKGEDGRLRWTCFDCRYRLVRGRQPRRAERVLTRLRCVLQARCAGCRYYDRTRNMVECDVDGCRAWVHDVGACGDAVGDGKDGRRRCLAHKCAGCSAGKAEVLPMRCARCGVGAHATCVPPSALALGGRYFVCFHHVADVRPRTRRAPRRPADAPARRSRSVRCRCWLPRWRGRCLRPRASSW